MAMPTLVRRWTRDEVLALPEDGIRYELIDGELLVTPSPRKVHQDAVAALLVEITHFIRARGIGEASIAPADLELRPGEIYQPDLFVTALVDGKPARDWADLPIPLLVVEISSPSTARYDRVVKRPAFQAAGVAEFWIVDLDSRVVERWRPADDRPEVLIDRLRWDPAGTSDGLEIDLRWLFSALLD